METCFSRFHFLKKTWKSMEFWLENVRFRHIKNMPKPRKGHRFWGFSVFRKSRKIDAKMAPKMLENWSKNRSRADQGRLIGRSGKNRRVLMSLQGANKSIKIEPRGAPRSPSDPRELRKGSSFGPWRPRPGQLSKITGKTMVQGSCWWLELGSSCQGSRQNHGWNLYKIYISLIYHQYIID